MDLLTSIGTFCVDHKILSIIMFACVIGLIDQTIIFVKNKIRGDKL